MQSVAKPSSCESESSKVRKVALVCRQWQHSEVSWPRLLQHHHSIQWDDYDKDYSDLPPQVTVPCNLILVLLAVLLVVLLVRTRKCNTP